MVNSIDSAYRLGNVQQDYAQRDASQERSSIDGTRIIEALKARGEELNLENSTDYHEVNQEKIKQAVDKLNKTMETYNTELRFQLHEKTGEYMVKIINTKDDSVVREIPPESILDMVAYFKEMVGLMVDKFA